MSNSDVETFQGKIVYNLDGSAYIIDPENESYSSSVPAAAAKTTAETLNSSGGGRERDSSSVNLSESALSLAASSSHQTPGRGGIVDASPGSQLNPSPKIHSFRIVSAHDAVNFKCHSSSNITVSSSSSSSRIESDSDNDNNNTDNEGESSSSGLRNSESSPAEPTAPASQRKRKRREPSGDREAACTRLHNPILMCFICKLSFGNTKSFSVHAKSEHSLNLQELEKQLLSREYSSAIIQRNMDEKPQISFLEPLDVQQMMPLELRESAAATTEEPATDEAGSGGKTEPREAAAAKAETETDKETEKEAKSNGNCSVLGHSQAEAKDATGRWDADPGASNIATADGGSAERSATPATTETSKATEGSSAPDARRTSSTEPCSTPKSQLPSEVSAEDAAASFHPKPNVDTSPSSRHSRRSSGEYKSLKDAAAAEFGLFQKQLQHNPVSGGMFPHHGQSPSPSAANSSAAAAALSAVALSAALSQHNQLSSLHASLAALTNDPSTNSVKFISELLQHQLAVQQMQQEQQFKHNSLLAAAPTCPDHPHGKGVDCKGCELLDAQHQIRSPVTPGSSPKHASSTKFLSTTTSLASPPTSHLLAPTTTTSAAATPTTVTIPSPAAAASAPAQVAASSAASSFTIGACSEHINGRPLGVDCSRCEMILNSARLNSGVQMSTRNSCKTLKCPQCNWHYKYQETLEIHMREKHPDGESACGYCLAGQQHPRLARGESYSCGYKPYRCEICNYSTTTKGNLSIHMQSDKHLNNMQELNSSQNMVAAAAAAAAGGPSAGAGKMDVSSKMLLSNSMNMQQAVAVAAAAAAASATPAQHQHPHQQQQQPPQTLPQTTSNSGSSVAGSGGTNSGKPKPSFRCDICSYETSVARNLRIHMTSEKHTHNMAVLQNNIKHIQAFSLLQQHQQATAAAAAAQQQQHLKAVSGNSSMVGGGNFLPEVAIADFAYNQALMIQLLHQQQQQQQQQQLSSSGSSNKSLVKMPPTSPTPPISDSPVSGSSGHQLAGHQFSPNCKGFGADAPPSAPSADLCLSSTFSGDPEDADSAYGLSVNCALKPDPSPQTLYSCLVCEVFNTNSLDELNQHLLLDRTRTPSGHTASSSSDIVLILNNNYICRLCNYKTNLKANFQLHSKTDKHLQKLNFINHIREGGPRNDYKLKLHQQQQQSQQQQSQQQQQQQVVQLKCNCCDYQTNSVQKLSLHSQHMRHETMRMIFQHLLTLQHKHQAKGGVEAATSGGPTGENTLGDDKDSYAESDDQSQDIAGKRPAADKSNAAAFAIECQLCNYVAVSLHDMIQHVKSLRHLQVEQFICLQRRSENMDTPNLEDVFRWCGHSKSQPHPATLQENCPSAEEADTLKTERLSPVPPVTTDEENTSNSFSDGHHDTKGSPHNSIPAVIYKCNNNCDYFAHSKQEIELHSEEAHPNCATSFISIPTNAAAIRAFQAAMAAAAVAAVANSTQRDAESDKLSPEQDNGDGDDNDDDDCPVAIKKERLEYDEPMDQDDGGNRTKAEAPKPAENARHPGDSEPLIEAHAGTPPPRSVQCPLCSDGFTEKSSLEVHLMRVHSVSRDGLSRLLQLVDQTAWKKVSPDTPAQSEPVSPTPSAGGGLPSRLSSDAAFAGLAGLSDQSQSRPASTSSVVSTTSIQSNQPLIQLPTPAMGLSEEFRCAVCGCGFKHEQLLLQHAQKAQHYRLLNGGEYACLASSHNTAPCPKVFASLAAMVAHYKDAHISLVISERHVYKYRCKQCSLAFKTQEKLTTHTLYHAMRDATKCTACQRNFRSTQALQKHMEQTHGATSGREHSTEGPENATNSDLAMDQAKSGGATGHGDEQQQGDLADEVGGSFSRAEKAMSPSKDQAMDSSGFGDLSLQQQQQQQQQQVAAITAALLKQQQQQQMHQFSSANSDAGENCSMPPNLSILQQMPIEAGLLSQKYMQQQQQQEQNMLQNHQQSLQSLQNLQHLQTQLPQLAAAAAASGLPLNPVDMLNLMQFHHLMSLNFMNLAPPLIFGATAGGTPANPGAAVSSSTPAMGARGGSGRVTPTDMPSRASNSAVAGPGGVVSSTGALSSPSVDTAQLLHPQQQPQQTSPASAAQISNNQKRARTRITDDQLKILRAHFDINNSPSEESIMEMSQKANLPMKVVKHWFRNTLFKERQRNKDSPYNFNNPPSTTLNLEEYERTGQAKVTPLGDFASLVPSQASNIGETGVKTGASVPAGAESLAADADDSHNSTSNIPMESQSRLNTVDFLTESHHLENRQQLDQVGGDTVRCHTSSVGSASSCAPEVHIKSEPVESESHDFKENNNKQLSDYAQQPPLMRPQEQLINPVFLKQQQQSNVAEHAMQQQQESDNLSEHLGAAGTSSTAMATGQQQHSAAQAQNSNYYNSYETKSESGSSDILSRPQTPLANPYNSMNEMLSQQLDNLPMNLGGNNMGPPKKFQMSKVFEKHSPSSAHFDTNSNSSNASSTSSGKRANRTRFTDYQIKVLQEFFENNSYPKDSDLEYLSKLLLLSPRVIVVWFQNARQKQRKIYENQPNNSLYESEEKKQNITYACKKCNLVFQRYYELIRHQKNHCFKEENNKKSAKAQIAAAQIAQNLSSEDSNSSMDIHNNNNNNTAVAAAAAASLLSGGGQHGLAAVAVGATPGISPQHLAFGKSSSASLVDFSPSTTPTPPHRESANAGSEAAAMLPNKMQKFECDKCKLSFNNYENFREHQLIHIMNPSLFLGQSPDAFGPFGSILQSLQQAAAANASQQQQQQMLPVQPSASAGSGAKKRKYSETSSNADDMSATGVSYAGESSEQQNKRYDFLYQYFLQNESSADVLGQFHAQQQQSQDPETEMEFLWNFYQQNEMRKRSNYDFLYQYYLKHEQQPQQQPNIEFLLQYYQLSESKKFFQLDASTQRTYDSTGEQQHPPVDSKESDTPDQSEHAAVANHDTCHASPSQKRAGDDSDEAAFGSAIDCSTVGHAGPYRRLSSHDNQPENDENVNKLQVPPFGCEDYLKNNLKQLVGSRGQARHDHELSSSPIPPGSPGPSAAGNAYFHNLDDFLVATMIENNQQTLTFNDAAAAGNLKASASVSPSFAAIHGEAAANSGGDTAEPAPAAVVPDKAIKASSNNNNDTNNKVQQNKRLRTTILPEQLNFLYECYQNESNPSRKMLEEISKKVNLKKRVVQVWYQNSRARERKGQFRHNSQIINKQCPYCSDTFNVRTALDWHIQSQHADKPIVNVNILTEI